jgi:hypothetical protein
MGHQEDWRRSLTIWDHQYTPESPAVADGPVFLGEMHGQPFMYHPESGPAGFSTSTVSNESLLTMQNYMEGISPIMNEEEFAAINTYHFQPEPKHFSRPKMYQHVSSPALLHGSPLASPNQDHGLGVSTESPVEDYFMQSPESQVSQSQWEEKVQTKQPTPTLTHLVAPSTSSQSSKRSSRSLDEEGDTLPIPEAKSKRTPLKGRQVRTLPDTEPAKGNGPSTAKLAHNIVERNYRDRLNDQIAELSNYLFDFAAESKREFLSANSEVEKVANF